VITRDDVTRLNEAASTLQAFWQSLIPECTPILSQFSYWASHFSSEHIEVAIQRTAVKARQQRTAGNPMDYDWLVRYASKVMQNKKFEAGGHLPKKLDWSNDGPR
jgi:hypothetical protein